MTQIWLKSDSNRTQIRSFINLKLQVPWSAEFSLKRLPSSSKWSGNVILSKKLFYHKFRQCFLSKFWQLFAVSGMTDSWVFWGSKNFCSKIHFWIDGLFLFEITHQNRHPNASKSSRRKRSHTFFRITSEKCPVWTGVKSTFSYE